MKYTIKRVRLMAVGKRIRDIRKKLNLTQGDFAKKVNVSSQVISNWEREYTKPNSEDIERISSNLKINPNYLYGLTNDPTIKKSQNELTDSNGKETNFDSLAEINNLVEKYGLDQLGFFDIEQWKNLSPDDVLLLEEQFKSIVKFAKKRNENNKD
jgi:HTH-type transcriptional regulator, competence development regulator